MLKNIFSKNDKLIVDIIYNEIRVMRNDIKNNYVPTRLSLPTKHTILSCTVDGFACYVHSIVLTKFQDFSSGPSVPVPHTLHGNR